MKYEFDEAKRKLERRGAKFDEAKKEIDMTRPKVGRVGINTLGMLEYFKKQNYRVMLPEVEYRPKKGYKGITKP